MEALTDIYREATNSMGTNVFWFLFITLLVLAAVITWVIRIEIYDRKDRRLAILVRGEGYVLTKVYVPKQTHISSGTVITNSSDGPGVGLVSSTSHSNEEFIVFVRTVSGNTLKFFTNMEYFHSLKEGNNVRYERKIGGLSKQVLESYLIR